MADATVEMDQSVDISAAFFEATMKAFRNDFQLGGTDRISNLRGQGPMVSRLTWGGKSYIGLDLWLDILAIESNT